MSFAILIALVGGQGRAQVVEPSAAPIPTVASPTELSSIEKAADMVADIRENLSDLEAARLALNCFDGELKETRLVLAAHGRLSVEQKARPVVEERRAAVAGNAARALDRLAPLLDAYPSADQHLTKGWLRQELARLEQHPFAGPELNAKAAALLDHGALLLPPEKQKTFYVNGTSVETLRRELGEYRFTLIFMGAGVPVVLFWLAWLARDALDVSSLAMGVGVYLMGLFPGSWYYGLKKEFVEEAERKAALIPAPKAKHYLLSEKGWDNGFDEKAIEEARADLLLGSSPPSPEPASLSAEDKGIIGRRGRTIFSALSQPDAGIAPSGGRTE